MRWPPTNITNTFDVGAVDLGVPRHVRWPDHSATQPRLQTVQTFS
jgi:hypothetical protein